MEVRTNYNMGSEDWGSDIPAIVPGDVPASRMTYPGQALAMFSP